MKRSSWRKSKSSTCNPAMPRRASCLTKKALTKLKRHWNLRHPDAQISATSPEMVSFELQVNLASSCQNERCLVREILGENNELEAQLFAPRAPSSWVSNPNEWLDSTDISNVMRQFENAHSTFVFLGPAPIDFQTASSQGRVIWDELANINIAENYRRDKTKIGFIFNTDTHDQPGEHWIAMYSDLNPTNRKPFIFFMDSAGDQIPPEVKSLVTKITKQCSDLGIQISYHDPGGLVHQKGDNECGMYCIYMITELLRGRNFEDFQSKRITDEEMSDCREAYFDNTIRH